MTEQDLTRRRFMQLTGVALVGTAGTGTATAKLRRHRNGGHHGRHRHRNDPRRNNRRENRYRRRQRRQARRKTSQRRRQLDTGGPAVGSSDGGGTADNDFFRYINRVRTYPDLSALSLL